MRARRPEKVWPRVWAALVWRCRVAVGFHKRPGCAPELGRGDLVCAARRRQTRTCSPPPSLHHARRWRTPLPRPHAHAISGGVAPHHCSPDRSYRSTARLVAHTSKQRSTGTNTPAANYNPKALQLDPEGNAHVHTGPIVTGFFGMLRRVYRIEVSR